jgi:uroporphyrinogen III methyltransferase/synthase
MCDAAETFDWIVFTSVNGVEHFMTRFLARRDIRDLKGVRLCAVGPATAARIERLGVRVDVTAAEFRAEGVLAALAAAGELEGLRILLPRAQIARDVLGDELRKAGAEVVELTTYTTEPGGDTGQRVYRMLLDRQIDAVTFTSASTLRNFVGILGGEQAADLLRTTVVAVIGPVTAEAAQHLGITAAVMPAEYTVPALVDALVTHFTHHPDSATVPR